MKAQAKTKKLSKVLATSTDKFGRPSKLTPEIIIKAWEYLQQTTSVSPRAGGMIPTKEKLALVLNVSRQTLDNWADNNYDFLDILDTLEKMQADILLQHGLLGTYNSTIAKLMLSKHGYIEKTENANTHEMIQPIVGGMAKAEVTDDSNDQETED